MTGEKKSAVYCLSDSKYFFSLVVHQTLLCICWHVQCIWQCAKSLLFGSDKCPQKQGNPAGLPSQAVPDSVCGSDCYPTAGPALHQGCGLCRELGCLAQPPHSLPDCSRSDPGIQCPPCGPCQEAALFMSSLSLPPGPGPRTGWYSFGNAPLFHASLLEVTVERVKNKWAIRAKPLSSQNISLCIRASGAFVWACCMNWWN